jgi:hypothetical protein
MIFPAQHFTQSQIHRWHQELYEEWISELPDNWIFHFVTYGLVPFLRSHGYILWYDTKQIITLCKEWAFCHILLKRYGSYYKNINFKEYVHNGGPEELDWYHYKIPTEDWFTLCSKWSNTDFLDESDPGYSQQLDLSNFVWHLLSLDTSPSHIEWIQINTTFEHQYDDPYGHPIGSDEIGTYSNDRRTL